MSGGSGGGSGGGGSACLRAVGRGAVWAVACALVGVGIPLWYLNAGAAGGRLSTALAGSGFVPPEDAARIDGIVDAVRRYGLIVAIAAACAAAVGAVADVAAACARAPASTPALRARAAFAGAGAAAAWLLTLAAAALFSVYLAWLVAAYALDAGLGAAAQPISGAEKAAASGVASVSGLIKKLGDEARAALDRAPPEVASTAWHKAAVDQLNSAFDQVNLDAPAQPDATCPAGCISLGPAAAAPGGLPKCLCVAATAGALREDARAMQGSLVPAAVGLLLLFVAATWMLARAAAALAVSRHELRERRSGGGGKLPSFEQTGPPGSIAMFARGARAGGGGGGHYGAQWLPQPQSPPLQPQAPAYVRH